MRHNDWLVTGFSIVVLATATAMAPRSPTSSVIELRADAGERVVLPLKLGPVAVSSLPALDESSLFGIRVAPRVAEVVPVAADVPHEPVGLSASPRRERRLASRLRRFGSDVPLPPPGDAPKAAIEKADLAVVELDAPTWRPRSTVALTPEALVSTAGRAALGFQLNERASLSVGPLSSMVPNYAPEAGHGDIHERWRLDENDGSQVPGAAVGMTFKLN
jgi:hypothetical protein